MYKNVGSKIQVMGQVIGWLLLIVGIILWIFKCIISGYRGDALIGWISLAAGVVGFFSSWILYAFGQIVNDIHALRENTENNKNT